MVKMTTIRPFK